MIDDDVRRGVSLQRAFMFVPRISLPESHVPDDDIALVTERCAVARHRDPGARRRGPIDGGIAADRQFRFQRDRAGHAEHHIPPACTHGVTQRSRTGIVQVGHRVFGCSSSRIGPVTLRSRERYGIGPRRSQ